MLYHSVVYHIIYVRGAHCPEHRFNLDSKGHIVWGPYLGGPHSQLICHRMPYDMAWGASWKPC